MKVIFKDFGTHALSIGINYTKLAVDGIETIKAIKNKYPYMTNYLEACLKKLKRYRNMI